MTQAIIIVAVDISIPLDCFVVKDDSLSNCDDRTAIISVGWGPDLLLWFIVVIPVTNKRFNSYLQSLLFFKL